MDNKESEVATTTTVVAQENVQMIIKSPLFLVFAEYLGYESPLIEWAEEWCKGNNIPKYQRTIIEMDALDTYHKMGSEYTDAELRKYYADFYDVVLSDYELNLIRLELKEEENSTLPL